MLLTAIRSNLENLFPQHQEGFLRDDFYEEVGVTLFATYGHAFFAFNLPLTKSFKAELTRILAEKEQSTDH